MRRTHLIRSTVAIAGAAVLAACAAPGPFIRTDADSSADFNSYRTFSFAEQVGTDRAGYSSLIGNYFKQAVQREMEAHGYQHSSGATDLLVNFNTNVRLQTDLETSPTASAGYYGYRYGYYGGLSGQEISTVHYKVGTVNVDVVDARRKQVIWEGVAEGELTEKVMKNPQVAIDKVIKALFAEFPGGSSTSTNKQARVAHP